MSAADTQAERSEILRRLEGFGAMRSLDCPATRILGVVGGPACTMGCGCPYAAHQATPASTDRRLTARLARAV